MTAILLIDDNPDQIAITSRVLAKSGGGYQLDAAANAQEGLARVQAGRYDLVLCDYRLPDMSGVDLLKQLGGTPPFILVTAMGSERLAVEAMKLGAYDYLVKDTAYETLLPEVVRQALARHQERLVRERAEAERNAAVQALKEEKARLERLNAMMVDREMRMVELKQQVNTLLAELGRPLQYQ